MESNSGVVEVFREELLLFCYRMGGSLREAEDLVEETLAKAGGAALPDDTDRARARLFGTAARLCMRALTDRPARVLPRLANPPGDPRLPPLPGEEGRQWLEPFPDDLYRQAAPGGERRYGERESVSLYFTASLQSLRPDERICIILGDVMGWSVESLTRVLDGGAAEARAVLEEARASMSRTYDGAMGTREPPADNAAAEFLMRYLFAWESGDAVALMERLSEDVVLQLPPSPSWYAGRDAVEEHLAAGMLAGAARGRWRLLPRRANGQLAFGVYQRDEERRVFRAHSIQVLHFAGELVAEIVSFGYPWLFPIFQLLPEVVVQG
ncbi:MAG: nuclear transport factor 2 family protein [Actinomycetota bacterium]|nr:nuclear transport factor 2 family protein [Actinomycetota bacterium]MDD5667509.1 nuclear transport factor 2 family protein [Actinomycetota bacterium]